MPRFPADIDRARMLRRRQLREAAEHRERQTEADAKNAAALAEMRAAFAERMGVKPEKLTMIVCRRGSLT